jgi:2-oxoglutarate dehydrogenase E1 component
MRTTRTFYAERLAQEGSVPSESSKAMLDAFNARLEEAFEASQSFRPNKADWLEGHWSGLRPAGSTDEAEQLEATSVTPEILKEVGEALCRVPKEFGVNSKIARQLEQKRQAIDTGDGIDWATGEALAFGSLLLEGHRVRLSGEDVQRGTFSHRHAVLIDQASQAEYTPLNNIRTGQAKFEAFNSLLAEFGVLGFDYGYSLADPKTMVLWEGQFGDFANGAQVIIDQFIASGETKWLRMSGLVMLLPHGYEGQGPEHSSARLERYLQLCAERNMRVCNFTTPANYFHILRRQIHRTFRKPLVLMTPKSLLRHPLCVSEADAFTTGSSFHRVLWDDAQKGHSETVLKPDAQIRRVVLCSGKVYYDLLAERDARGLDDVYLLRIEQFYPFPALSLVKELERFKGAEIVWCQEEPKNQGAWSFLEPNLEWVLGRIGAVHGRAVYAGRAASASPATGLASRHKAEQAALVNDALTIGGKDGG